MGPLVSAVRRTGGRSPVHRPCDPHRAAGRSWRRCGERSLRALLRTDLRLLPAPARVARGGGGRRPDDLHERLPRPLAGNRPRARVGLAVQDRPQRVPLAPTLLLASRQGRVAEQLRGAPGDHSRTRAGLGRADLAPRRARGDAREPAARDSSAGVARTHLSRNLGRARALSGCGRDADLPRTSRARSGPGARR